MRFVVLTGAGISAESGVPTFRDAGGLWEGHRVEDVATPEGFARDSDTVHRFYDARRRAAAQAEPNPAHLALARLEQLLGDDLLIVTQNVDDLHDDLFTALCEACGDRSPHEADLIERPPCPNCGERMLRPDVVWFGEMPYELDRIDEALVRCDLFAAIGTSGGVYPAAGFVMIALEVGARTIELNLAESEITPLFDEVRHGPASIVVPEWVEEQLATIS
jgi:NAD-dependent deacetylase